MDTHQRVALLGTGVMGTAILAGLARIEEGPDVVVADAAPGRAATVAADHGVAHATTAADAARGADVVLLAVKPKDVEALLAELAPVVTDRTLVVSVAAGLPTGFYERRLPPGVPVVRVMPNTPATIGRGISAISPGASAGEEHLTTTAGLLASTGAVVRVAEKDLDAVTALSGSGPAYVFYVIDALAEAGVLLGLTRELATTLATQTVLGSAELVASTGEHPAVLRERVSSPGGTTVAGLRALDAAAVRAALVDAVVAARDRSVELGRDLG